MSAIPLSARPGGKGSRAATATHTLATLATDPRQRVRRRKRRTETSRDAQHQRLDISATHHQRHAFARETIARRKGHA
eukprot:1407195-Rhodomonas_salina.1